METRDDMGLSQKEAKLIECLKRYATLGVAFSGGVDSTLLLAAAQRVLGQRVVALTAQSDIHPSGEREQALALARQLGVRHILFETHELDDPLFTANSPDRCYHCKKSLFSAIQREATVLGIETLAHGANLDDLSDFRPGFKAAREMGIAAPLIDAGLTKTDIRRLAQRLGLSNWDRPAMACLATRVPYGLTIDPQMLARIDKAETCLRGLGVVRCRVRHHGNLARIEADPADMVQLAEPQCRARVVTALRGLGYAYVCLDLEGYLSGKMNRDLAP
ncbi:MAG: ATP-dependent sacrificial sulfur transferase LarE [Desulfatitalea sp.]